MNYLKGFSLLEVLLSLILLTCLILTTTEQQAFTGRLLNQLTNNSTELIKDAVHFLLANKGKARREPAIA